MNAGKSTSLLQSNHNYKARNLKTYIFAPKVDAEFHQGKIHSRLGVEEKQMFLMKVSIFTNTLKIKKLKKFHAFLSMKPSF